MQGLSDLNSFMNSSVFVDFSPSPNSIVFWLELSKACDLESRIFLVKLCFIYKIYIMKKILFYGFNGHFIRKDDMKIDSSIFPFCFLSDFSNDLDNLV